VLYGWALIGAVRSTQKGRAEGGSGMGEGGHLDGNATCATGLRHNDPDLHGSYEAKWVQLLSMAGN